MQVGAGGDIWKLEAEETQAPTPIAVPTAYNAYPLLSSGQIGVVPFVDPDRGEMDVSTTLFAGDTSSAKAIDSVHLTVSTGSTELATRVATAMEFDMKRATFKMVSKSDGGDHLSVTHELCVLLNLPNVVMHRVSIERTDGAPLSEMLRLQHEMRGSSDDETLDFSSALAATALGQVYLSQGKGDAAVCVCGIRIPAALTLVDLPEHTEPATSSGGRRRAVSTLLLQPDGIETRVQVVAYSSLVRDGNAMVNAKRTALAAMSADPDVLYARHAAMWNARWQSSIDITNGASDRVRSAITYATYNLHARADAFRQMNAAGAQGRGDDFVTAALIYISPEAARARLELRAGEAQRRQAREQAELCGLDGARYPYGPLECKQTVLLGTQMPNTQMPAPPVPAHGLHRVHGTLMTGINAWNYYRVSKDRAWLRDPGYLLISSAADMISSLATLNPDGVTYTLEGAVGISDCTASSVVNATLPVASTVALLRVACECAYAMGMAPKQRWLDVRFGLSALPMLQADKGGAEIVPESLRPLARFEGDDLADDLNLAVVARTNGLRVGQVAPEEVLLVLSEPIGTLVEADMGFNIVSNISRNYSTWGADQEVVGGIAVSAATPDPVRRLIRLMSMAQAMQVNSTLSAGFLAAFDAFLDDHRDPVGFGNLSAAASTNQDASNDVELSALLVLVVLNGLGGAMVQGGYGESGIEYATLGVSMASSAIMPELWERLVVRGIGGYVSAVLLNRGILGAVNDQSGGGGSGGTLDVGWGTSSIVYWSTETLTL